jgi:TPR repeat protein
MFRLVVGRHQLGWGGDQASAADVQKRIAALEADVAKWQAEAERRQHFRRGLASVIAVLALALGFVLGLYGGPIKQTAADLALTLGMARVGQDGDAASAAYRNGNFTTALRLLRPLAERGDAHAQFNLGVMHYHGRGVRQSDAEAARWFHLAADQGDAPAQFYLGILYSEGQGVPQDDAEGTRWYRRAADQGHAQAQYNLGLWYATGGDNVTAHMWFNLAAARFPASDTRNRNLAVRNRDLVAGKMTRDQIVQAQALAREWKPR